MEFLLFLQEHQYPILEVFFQGISLLLDKTIVVAIVSYFYWCNDKKLAHKMAVSYFISGLSIQYIKLTCRIPRPWILDKRIKPSQKMMNTATGYSFPSGHTQTATSLCYSVLEKIKNKKVYLLVILFPFLTMFSRMYVLVHTPYDVTVSFLLTLILTMITIRLLNKDHDFYLKKMCWLMMILSVIGTIYFYYLISTTIVDNKLGLDGIKMMGSVLGFSIGYLLENKFVNYQIPKLTTKQKCLIMIGGLLGALVFKSGLSLLLPQYFLFDFLRYFLTILWIIYLYPVLLVKINIYK